MTTASWTFVRGWLPHVTQATCIAAVAACGAPDLDEGDDPAVTEQAIDVGIPANGRGAGFPMRFHNGFVQEHHKVWLLFWGPKWQSDATHRAVIQRVENTFRQLAGSEYNNLLTQYGVSADNYVRSEE